MRIVFLYAELMPNLFPVFKTLIAEHSAEIHVVHWDHRKKTPYAPQPIKGLTLYDRSTHPYRAIRELLRSVNPDAIYIAGWMDRSYLRAVIPYRRKQVPIVVGFDDWWKGSLRQSLARAVSPLLTKVLFSHAWVAGPRQYEYAKRLGFADRVIIPNLLSCDCDLFHGTYETAIRSRTSSPPVFLYVGRFSPEKGIALLAAGFEMYRTEFDGQWELLCVGNGPQLELLAGKSGIEVRPFSSQAELAETMLRSGAFVMPSLRDFSPLAVHEAACAGLPLVLSSNVGNIPLFLIHNYNGFVFDSGSAEDLALALHRMATRSRDELARMGSGSHRLSHRITPEICAASFASCIRHA